MSSSPFELLHFVDPVSNTISHLLADLASGEAAIIDPVLDYQHASGQVGTQSADAMLATLHAHGWTLRWLLETHAHADHLSAAAYLRGRTGAPVVIGAPIDGVQRHFEAVFHVPSAREPQAFDRLVREGDELPLGALRIGVIATPGHTPACVAYHVADAVFVGDTLFMPDCGTARADFPGGDAPTLYRSIRKLLALPPATRLFMCHDYPPPARSELLSESSVAEQRVHNIHVNDGVDEATFVAMRTRRDATLTPPALLLPALQVNIRAGELPKAEDNGRAYLKIPLQVPPPLQRGAA